MKKLIVIVPLLLAACGSPTWVDAARQHSASGNCAAAVNDIRSEEPDPGLRATYIGAIYYDCYHDRATAIRYLTLGARYGIPPAREYLIQFNAPLPAEDLLVK
jgi:hypothetical protein